MRNGDQDQIVAELGRLGEFFTITIGQPDSGTATLAELAGDRRVLAGYLAWYAGRLRTAEARVAGSILFQGLAARLWSPVIAGVLVYDRIPTLDPHETYWHPAAASGRLVTTGARFDSSGYAEAIASVVNRILAPLATSIHHRARVAEALLWGNAASALMGSLGVLASVRPDTAAAGWVLAGKALDYGPLCGTGKFVDGGFVRSSCCLFYRVDDGGLCGDCVLRKA